ncbi:OmpH family outer membrane protein [Kineobactrum sediminis]|uniref:OmpH family outer membrane protein n=1 Tax=Kineobactrum sediminis TaxID=1905677 RepID=UPI001F4DFEAF|nr:OmpH family outer membrane protein [Kineobactrum sediminis]
MSKVLKIALVTAALAFPALGWAQGKIAVVNVEQSILQTDYAQKKLADERNNEDYKSDKTEFDRLKQEFDQLVAKFQKDAAVMSQDQQLEARRRLASKQADLEHVAGKLQTREQEVGQALLEEMSPQVQQVLQELIATEGIGLLLQRGSVIHADAGYSITAKVTDKLNQAFAN